MQTANVDCRRPRLQTVWFQHERSILMIMMTRHRGKSSVVVPFTIIVLCCLYPRFCRTQSNPCETSGTCGAFGICNSQESSICTCLRGFKPRNSQEWGSGNWRSGCSRSAPLKCEEAGNNGTAEQDVFLKVQIKISTGQSDRWFGQKTQCENRCLRNCSCVAYGFDTDIGCIFWSGTLQDIQEFPTGSGSDLFIRLSHSEIDADQKKTKGSKKTVVVILVVVGSVILSICIFFSWKWVAKYRGKIETTELATAGASVEDELDGVNFQELPLFKLEILANATNNFSEANKLGKGGFGPVYKGELANGREIAVKRLSQASKQGMKEFMNEMMLISKLQHRNLVRLLGCCVENKERMLVYEYMPNKSLDFILVDSPKEILDWSKRFNIIEGICRGLLYLHRDSRLKIIHRDLKPGNILLDNEWNPKISDFGMARIFGNKQDHVSTLRVVGTYGYMAPEYAMGGRFSEKSDVFSFGVLILEITSGRRNTSFNHQDGPLNLLGYVWKLWEEGNVATSIDPKISIPSNEAEVVRCIHIGLLCVQEFPQDRPSISAVLSMLSSEIIELPEPKQPAFTTKASHCDAGMPGTSYSQQSKSSCSLNNVTLTVVDGR